MNYCAENTGCEVLRMYCVAYCLFNERNYSKIETDYKYNGYAAQRQTHFSIHIKVFFLFRASFSLPRTSFSFLRTSLSLLRTPFYSLLAISVSADSLSIMLVIALSVVAFWASFNNICRKLQNIYTVVAYARRTATLYKLYWPFAFHWLLNKKRDTRTDSLYLFHTDS